MIQKKLLFVSIYIITLNACSAQKCTDLPITYKSYEIASEYINSAEFNLQDKINTSKSSWMKEVKFLSCNLEDGYLIITTSRKTYIHSKFPKKLWLEFKESSSLGKYYNSNIKGRYQLKLDG